MVIGGQNGRYLNTHRVRTKYMRFKVLLHAIFIRLTAKEG